MAVSSAELLGFQRDVLMVLAWGINIAIAEMLIRRTFAPRASFAVASNPQCPPQSKGGRKQEGRKERRLNATT